MESDTLGKSSAGPEMLNGVTIWLLRSGWRYTKLSLAVRGVARRLVAFGDPLWRMGADIPTTALEQEVFAPADEVRSSATPAR